MTPKPVAVPMLVVFLMSGPLHMAGAGTELVACDMAKQLEILSASAAERIERLIAKAGLPTKISGVKLENILRAQAHDKKFSSGRNRFVLPVCIGKVAAKEDIPKEIIVKAIKSRMGR